MDTQRPVSKLIVTESFAEQRIDNYLFRELKSVPKSTIYRWLRTGQIRVNGKRKKPDYKLETHDEIRLPPMHLLEKRVVDTPEQVDWLKSAILFEDADILVLNKPAGLPVHGGSGHAAGAIELLRVLYNQPRIELVHRLDKDTSGCLLVAKKRQVLRPLMEQLQNKQLQKSYLALLKGRFARNRRVQLSLLRTQNQHQDKMIVDDAGKAAQTDFEVLCVYEGCTWVRATIATGRMHQIRAHAKAIDHPIVGDVLYGDQVFNQEFAEQTGFSKLWLHAETLSFVHPLTEQPISVVAPLPEKQQQILDVLKN
jgi:23S rRNA pseudouridine955/2504/2580 synthase